jgi:sugar phosphate isomerase/epimerase
MLKEMADFGFEYVELSHGIRISLVPGILKAVEEGVIRIGSTHNFCPLPAGVLQAAPNIFEPSSGDPRQQDQWFRHTKRSLDVAAQVKARVLVCHLGSVVFFWFNPARRLLRYLEEAKPDDPGADEKYQELLARSVTKMRKRMGPYWERTKANVARVLDHAAQKGIRLGFENREKFEELPMDADFPEFLGSLPAGGPAGYWHDTGHAEIKRAMGLLDHRTHLEKNAARLIGFHLHDVDAQGHDHQAVGSGRIDFDMVSSFWRPEHVLVIELGPRATAEDVRMSKARVESLVEKI